MELAVAILLTGFLWTAALWRAERREHNDTASELYALQEEFDRSELTRSAHVREHSRLHDRIAELEGWLADIRMIADSDALNLEAAKLKTTRE